MMKKGLGKGLDALLGDFTALPPEGEQQVDVYLIDTNSKQPRKAFDEEKLAELAESIKLHGVVQPIILRQSGDRYVIVAGERRYRAARLAGLKKVPALIKQLEDAEVMEIALIENLQREDLNPVEEAAAIRFLMQQHDLTQEEVAARLGKSRPAIANTLRLLNLPSAVQDMLREGKMQAGHARVLAGMKQKAAQEKLAQAILAEGLSVRETERRAKLMEAEPQTPAKKEPKRPHDTDLAAAQQQLQERLETKVRIDGTQAKGKLVIEYYSKDALSGLYELLMRQ